MISDLLDRFSSTTVVEIDSSELDELLGACELVREDGDGISGPIRVLRTGEVLLVQEQTPKREFLVRRLDSLEAAMKFVDDRLASYERMWDG